MQFLSVSTIALALLAVSAEAQSVMERAQPWPVPARIDVSKQKAPAPVPVQRKWTVAMWDFPRFELNALISAPWRAPLLYESGPQGREVLLDFLLFLRRHFAAQPSEVRAPLQLEVFVHLRTIHVIAGHGRR